MKLKNTLFWERQWAPFCEWQGFKKFYRYIKGEPARRHNQGCDPTKILLVETSTGPNMFFLLILHLG